MDTSTLFECARKAYESPTELKTKEEIFSFLHDVEAVHLWDASKLGNSESDAQYYCLVLKDSLVYAIRGTSSLEDAITDVRFFQEPFQDIVYSCSSASIGNQDSQLIVLNRKSSRVHGGFLEQYNSIKFSIMSTIFTHVLKGKTPKRIIFVGHSLGGALATLAAAGTKAIFPQLFVQCTTYGSPRVGNMAFSAYFNAVVDVSERFVNGSDKVTKNPSIGYAHVGGDIRVGEQTPGWFRNFFGSIEEHRLDSYAKALLDHHPIVPT